LELLLAQDLAALLPTAHQVGHDLLGGAERYILVYLEAVSRKLTSDLVRETTKLTEKD